MSTPESPQENFILGKVTTSRKTALKSLSVKAYHKTMRSEALLAEATTDAVGDYEMCWTSSQLIEIDAEHADIALKVFSAVGGKLLFRNPNA